MTTTIDAVFDGTVLLPDEPLALPPNTRVRLTLESPAPSREGSSFLDTACSLHLTGPGDWSRNLEEYLYGDKTHPE